LPLFRTLSEFSNRDVSCFYKLSKGELRPIRIVAMKKDAIDNSRRKMARKASKKQEKPAQQYTAELNEYIVLATNLSNTNEQILELYRARWQIEQVFFRLKSLFGYGEAPGTNPDSVKAWLYGKLLIAALCEAIIKAESFSPEEEKLFFGFANSKFME
jgi:transposase